MGKGKRLAIFVSDENFEWLKAESECLGMTISTLIRMIIRQAMEQDGQSND